MGIVRRTLSFGLPIAAMIAALHGYDTKIKSYPVQELDRIIAYSEQHGTRKDFGLLLNLNDGTEITLTHRRPKIKGVFIPARKGRYDIKINKGKIYCYDLNSDGFDTNADRLASLGSIDEVYTDGDFDYRSTRADFFDTFLANRKRQALVNDIIDALGL